MYCEFCFSPDHSIRECEGLPYKVIGYNRAKFTKEMWETPIPIQCECSNCGNKWRDITYGVVKNSIYKYDYCSKCNNGNDPLGAA